MIFGMALFKMEILYGNRSFRFYLFLTIACYCIALPLRDLVIRLEYIAGPNTFVWQRSAIFIGTGIPITLGHISLFFYSLPN